MSKTVKSRKSAKSSKSTKRKLSLVPAPSAPTMSPEPIPSLSAYRSHARSISSRVVIGFRIDPELKESLHKKLKQRKLRSISDLMETVVIEWLDRQDGHATPTDATLQGE